MVTDRIIIASNGSTSLVLTEKPFSVNLTNGFDKLKVVNVTSQGFDQDGASLLNSYVQPRDMEIKGQIQASTTSQMQMLRDRLLDLFIPKVDITITHFYGGRNRVITTRVEQTPDIKFTNVSTIQEYTISLTATEPYWRDVTETLVQIANVSGGFHFPLIIPKDEGIIFGLKSASLIADVYNYSSIKVGMRIIFQAAGHVENPQLFDVNKRKFIRILCEMEAGDQIIIETGQNKTVTRIKNGVSEDYMGHIDLAGGGNTFLELDPKDNLFRYSAGDGEDMLETKIYFFNKYPGV